MVPEWIAGDTQKTSFPHMISVECRSPKLRWCCEWFPSNAPNDSCFWTSPRWYYFVKKCGSSHVGNHYACLNSSKPFIANHNQKHHHNHTAKTTTMTKTYHLTLRNAPLTGTRKQQTHQASPKCPPSEDKMWNNVTKTAPARSRDLVLVSLHHWS